MQVTYCAWHAFAKNILKCPIQFYLSLKRNKAMDSQLRYFVSFPG